MNHDWDSGLIGIPELINEVHGESTKIIHVVQNYLVSSSFDGTLPD